MTTSPTFSTNYSDAKRLGLPNIAFVGKAGAGKSSAALLLKQLRTPGYSIYSLAAPLKDIASFIWGEDARTDRSKLQPLGVAVREIEEDAWVNHLLRRISVAKGPVAVDDVRFPNEYYALKGAGFTFVRIYAPASLRADRLKANGKELDSTQQQHVSETALDEFPADYGIDNDRGEFELYEQLCEVVVKEAKRR